MTAGNLPTSLPGICPRSAALRSEFASRWMGELDVAQPARHPRLHQARPLWALAHRCLASTPARKRPAVRAWRRLDKDRRYIVELLGRSLGASLTRLNLGIRAFGIRRRRGAQPALPRNRPAALCRALAREPRFILAANDARERVCRQAAASTVARLLGRGNLADTGAVNRTARVPDCAPTAGAPRGRGFCKTNSLGHGHNPRLATPAVAPGFRFLRRRLGT